MIFIVILLMKIEPHKLSPTDKDHQKDVDIIEINEIKNQTFLGKGKEIDLNLMEIEM